MKKRTTIICSILLFFLIGTIPFLQTLLGDSEVVIRGENVNQLNSPMGAATDDSYVYIANSNKNQVSVFNLKGEFQFPIGSIDGGESGLHFPVDVELYKDKVYVADLENYRVCIFTKDGQFIDYFPRERNIKPAALTIKDGFVFVSDIYSHSIKKFSLTGELLENFAKNGKAEGQLDYANGIAVSDKGDVIVADTLNQRIQQFTAAGQFTKILYHDESFGLPKGISISKNNLYLADAQLQEIFILDLKGEKISEVKTKEKLKFPTDVFLTENYLVITDNGDNKVLVIKRGDGDGE